MSAPPPPALAEALADLYRLERELGRGGMATVYLARDLKHHRLVAIKVLHPELGAALGPERFLREIEIAAGLQHPHILPLHDSGQVGAFLYYVTAYVEGGSLRNRLTREKQLPLDEALEIARHVASALVYAHAHGIVHRDIKPENILLEGDQAVVADFGIARAVREAGGERITETGLALGTPSYMSPEQATGERDLDGRSDLYSLACVVYEMLAGEPPFTGATPQAVMAKRLVGPVPRLRVVREGVPEGLERAIERALAKVPADRFAGVAQFAAALSAAGRVPSPAVSHARRRRRALALTSAAVLGLAGVVALAARVLRPGTPVALDANLLAVAPFDVLAPELELWREGLVDVLSRNFDGAGSLHTVPPRLTIRRWSGRADPSDAQTLGRRTGARLVVYGQLVGSGRDSVRLRATLLDASDGRHIGEADLRDLSAHLDRLADSGTVTLLRALARERPLEAIRRTSFGGASLPALKEFLRGEQFVRRALYDSALAHYDAAIALDSGFALAYRRMRYALGWEPAPNRPYREPSFYVLRAAALNRGLTSRDSLLIVLDSMFYYLDPGQAVGDHPLLQRSPEEDTAFFVHRRRLIAAAEQAVELYPEDPEAWNALGEVRFHTFYPWSVGRPGTLEALDRAIQLDPDYAPGYEHIVQASAARGRVDLARARAAAFLKLAPVDPRHQTLRLQAAVLDPTRSETPETARLLDTASAGALFSAAFFLFPAPDSGEAALRLARGFLSRRESAPPAAEDSLSRARDSLDLRYFLAHAFAFRGHVREARAIWPAWPSWLAEGRSASCKDVAAIGVLPAESVSVALKSVQVHDLHLWKYGCGLRMAPTWWYAMRDSTNLVRFRQRMRPVARSQSKPIARVSLQYLADAAGAYLALTRNDSAQALGLFAALPDSLCEFMVTGCFYEKLTQARLSAALGQLQGAADLYDRWLFQHYWSPLYILGRLERARLAERLGEPATAAGHYQFVLDVWRHADPELRPYVDEARAALGRLSAEQR